MTEEPTKTVDWRRGSPVGVTRLMKVAPTLLAMLGLDQPTEMTGKNLIERI